MAELSSPAVRSRPLYFIGCDMGGWHTDDGDALAACRWHEGRLTHVVAECGDFFYPVPETGVVASLLRRASNEQARIIVAIDAALAWPTFFAELVKSAPFACHQARFDLGDAIDNPYLYRETERFVKRHVLTNNSERPLTAPGDKFGNNSSKAQSLVAWFATQFVHCGRPPFDHPQIEREEANDCTIIEVYPAASKKSEMFNELQWPDHSERMRRVGNTDIADAKRCAMTAVCYAMTVGIVEPEGMYPRVCLPTDERAKDYDQEAIRREGWIYVPYDERTLKK